MGCSITESQWTAPHHLKLSSTELNPLVLLGQHHLTGTSSPDPRLRIFTSRELLNVYSAYPRGFTHMHVRTHAHTGGGAYNKNITNKVESLFVPPTL